MSGVDTPPSRTLGEQESRLLTSLSAAGYTVFTINDARAVLGSSAANVRKLLHQLHRKRWIRRLERGKYLILPLAAGPEAEWAEHEYLIVSSLADPYYLAYATAFRYYGYSERPLDPVMVATTQRKQPLTIDNVTYRFVTLVPHKFFGFSPVRLGEHTVQMAEREKALCDGFDHPELVGGVLEAAKGLWFGSGEVDWHKLVGTMLRLRNQVAARRAGFWLELLELADEELLAQLDVGSGHSYALLEPGGPNDGPRNARWRLIVNIPERQLLEWREH
jgi:predicted transcriptional regulator of viral defense system